MKQTLQSLFFVTALGALIITSSCKKSDDPVPTPTPTPAPTVVGVAQGNTNFTILVAAVTKAGLVTALSDATKNFTVFAPTNAAFEALPAPFNSVANINNITSATEISNLAAILKYHVLGAKVLSGGVPTSDTVKTLDGRNIFASRSASNVVFVNGIKVTIADLPASNGVVHAIGKVLIPPTQTIAQIVIDGANFSLLERAVIVGGLASTLSGPGKFTVFAPLNSGFPAALDTEGEINAFDPTTLATVVKSHAFSTNIAAGDLVSGNTPATLNPLATLTIGLTTTPPTVKINGSANTASGIQVTDIIATNGIIHVIDKLLQ
jgi:uncharacterized surface protein with fasciclin (FAS1) repeats